MDHGKCIHGDSYVSLSNGDIVRISELYNKFANGSKVERIPTGLHVDSMNTETLEIEDRKAAYVWRLKSERLVAISLRNGRSISTTPEHPFFTLTPSGLITAKRAQDLKVEDFVAVAGTLKSTPADLNGIKEDIIQRLSAHEYYLAYLNGEQRARLLRELSSQGFKSVWESIGSPICYKSFLKGVKDGRYRLTDLLHISQLLGISRREVYDAIDYLAYRMSLRRVGRLSPKIWIPKLADNFLRLVYLYGLIVGDGTSRASLTNTSSETLSKYEQIMGECFGVSTKVVKMRTTLRADHHGGQTLIYFLKDVFGYPLTKKALNVPFPDIVLRMENKYVAAFLRGLFDADGSVEKARSAVTLSTASRDIGTRLPLALLRFDLVASTYRKGPCTIVAISGSQLRNFASSIGFTHKGKTRRLENLVSKLKPNRVVDIVPIEPTEVRSLRILLGIPASPKTMPYYSKYERGKQRLTRHMVRKITDEFSKKLPQLKEVNVKLGALERLSSSLKLDELARKTMISRPRLAGIIASLKADGLIAKSGKSYTTTEFGKEVMDLWRELLQGNRQLREKIETILQSWRAVSEADVRFVKVSGIKQLTESVEVYDLTVPGTNTFIANGVVVHNTTTTDSLLSAAGLLSPKLAGTALALDFLEEEQQRQMTIKAANISLYYELGGKPYVVNMIDTPGHIDFSGRVTRSLRAIDGAVVVVDAVEEVMIQTETVTRQALAERVRPVLYVNKMDRLVKELKLSPKLIQEKLARIITNFNGLIDTYAETEYREKWKVSPADGTVAIGSAKDRWGLTFPQAERKGIKFDKILEAFSRGDMEWLRNNFPLHEAILEMVISAMPPPHVAQRYRIPKIWHGDIESEIGQAMVNCDENGPVVMAVTDVKVDPSAGVVATGRLFSGTLRAGDQIHMMDARRDGRIQQVAVYMGQRRELVDYLPAGNIPALLGLDEARSGETIGPPAHELTPFEEIKYVSEPVVTIAVEPKHSRDLPKLVDFLNKLSIEDPTLVTTVRPDTGEYLISGMGTLHLEIAMTWITKTGLEVSASRPIVIYREAINRRGQRYEGKSPNRHNRVYIRAEPLTPEVLEAIRTGQLHDQMDRKQIAKMLRDFGWQTSEARNVWEIERHGNILVDATKGAQFLQETKVMIMSGFEDVANAGPLAQETLRGVKAILEDVKLHEDPIHRGFAQIVPASRRSFLASLLSAEPVLLEPMMKITVKIRPEDVGAVTGVIAQKRGKVLSVEQKEHLTFIIGEIPAVETFDLSEVMRSATSGRAFWGTEFSRWSPVPSSIRDQVIADIRKRKGLPPELPTISTFVED